MPYGGGGGGAASVPLAKEIYNNHLGNTDDFITTTIWQSGAVSHDSTNHRMDIEAGSGNYGYANYKSKKSWTASASVLVCNLLVQNLVENASGDVYTYLGFKNSFSIYSAVASAMFFMDDAGDWYTYSNNSGGTESNLISDIVSGDLLTIVLTSSKIEFYKNGTLLHTHTTRIPTSSLYVGAGIRANTTASPAREISIDFIGLELQM